MDFFDDDYPAFPPVPVSFADALWRKDCVMSQKSVRGGDYLKLGLISVGSEFVPGNNNRKGILFPSVSHGNGSTRAWLSIFGVDTKRC